MMYAPLGLPAILTLNRWGGTNPAIPLLPVDSNIDSGTLSWWIRLEITINPDQE